ncbi:hypothetical protein [Haloarcula sp. 1CSR25-25]|uniref:hypothetical protein n=1 Tax=Haloarcula sp. 1CSR25-25 TaxID=2862545 RepID=UPI002895C551|nr:hypothetical protein [Haloarcula sp. 1CSR25-25]MDT3434329.1 hypothetical protein [Haloarcula sp. 1CSR25-25]
MSRSTCATVSGFGGQAYSSVLFRGRPGGVATQRDDDAAKGLGKPYSGVFPGAPRFSLDGVPLGRKRSRREVLRPGQPKPGRKGGVRGTN